MGKDLVLKRIENNKKKLKLLEKQYAKIYKEMSSLRIKMKEDIRSICDHEFKYEGYECNKKEVWLCIHCGKIEER